jgi:hypothetical protein
MLFFLSTQQTVPDYYPIVCLELALNEAFLVMHETRFHFSMKTAETFLFVNLW